MVSLSECAVGFMNTCDAGRGWRECAEFCRPSATFSAQCDLLAHINALSDYANWVANFFEAIPSAQFTLKACGYNEGRRSVTLYSVFTGTHSHQGGPVPPTGGSFVADYVYSIESRWGLINHVTKVWNADWTLKELDWIEPARPSFANSARKSMLLDLWQCYPIHLFHHLIDAPLDFVVDFAAGEAHGRPSLR